MRYKSIIIITLLLITQLCSCKVEIEYQSEEVDFQSNNTHVEDTENSEFNLNEIGILIRRNESFIEKEVIGFPPILTIVCGDKIFDAIPTYYCMSKDGLYSDDLNDVVDNTTTPNFYEELEYDLELVGNEVIEYSFQVEPKEYEISSTNQKTDEADAQRFKGEDIFLDESLRGTRYIYFNVVYEAGRVHYLLKVNIGDD
jgi:hypothetical protein